MQLIFLIRITVTEGSHVSWAVPQHFSMIQKARQAAEQHCPHLPVRPSPGVYGADTYKILGNCGGSEAFTPQGMLHPGPVLCPAIPAICNSQTETKWSRDYCGFLPQFGNFPQKQQ